MVLTSLRRVKSVCVCVCVGRVEDAVTGRSYTQVRWSQNPEAKSQQTRNFRFGVITVYSAEYVPHATHFWVALVGMSHFGRTVRPFRNRAKCLCLELRLWFARLYGCRDIKVPSNFQTVPFERLLASHKSQISKRKRRNITNTIKGKYLLLSKLFEIRSVFDQRRSN